MFEGYRIVEGTWLLLIVMDWQCSVPYRVGNVVRYYLCIFGLFGWVEAPSPHPQPLPLARWHAGNRGALACQHAGLSLIGHVVRTTLFKGLPDKSETA